VTLRSHFRYKEIQARTCCGPLFERPSGALPPDRTHSVARLYPIIHAIMHLIVQVLNISHLIIQISNVSLSEQAKFGDVAICQARLTVPEGSYLRLIDSCITQLKAQGPSRTCNESNNTFNN